jgi:OOP family OmpA-OmpF porin
MMKKIHIVLAFLLLVVLSTPALAQIQPGAYSLSPFVGGFWFEGNQDLDHKPVYGLRLGHDFTKNWGAELVFDYVDTHYEPKDLHTNVYNYRIEGLYHFMPDSKVVPFLAAGLGGMSIDYRGDKSDRTRFTPALGGGLKYFVTDWMALRADVRYVMGIGSVYHNLEYALGLSFYFGGKRAAAPVVAAKAVEEPAKPKAAAPAVVAAPPVEEDSDKDGVPDSRDKCPGTPIGTRVDKYGCPVDSDQDGVPNYLDKCPETASGVAVDKDGCPVDSDHDGVPDYLDKCPETASGVAVDKYGCPPDADQDGVADYLDKCPGTPSGVAVGKDGCPVDSDQDGVADYLDKCPGTPSGVAVGKDGCPVPPEKVSITLAIEFDTGKADIKSRYHEEIGKVAAFLREYPTATGTIEGHTDNIGKAAMNQELSQRRAESAKNYLVQKFGIDPARLSAKGYGMTRPIADNETAEGRQKNRRIEAIFDAMVVKK